MSDGALNSNVQAKSQVSAEEKEQLYNHIIWEGTKAAAVAAGVTTAAVVAADRTWPTFRRLRLPFKAFLVLGVTTGTFFTVSDRASIRVSRQLAQRIAIHPQQAEAEIRQLEPITGVRQWLIRHRYPLVMTVWSGTLAGAFLYNLRRPDIPTAQKIINARLVAQVMALAGIGGIAALAATDPHEKQVDRHFEEVMNQGRQAVKAG
ncbi:hypothetical protein SpCBS45565_g04731 [Spizellomyces sp. 'palustris']|nr:hypothetical protein SpCBS45565_g04731 [Spizellomyces sp. 'palustris']